MEGDIAEVDAPEEEEDEEDEEAAVGGNTKSGSSAKKPRLGSDRKPALAGIGRAGPTRSTVGGGNTSLSPWPASLGACSDTKIR